MINKYEYKNKDFNTKIYELDILKGIWIIGVIIFYLLFFIHAFSYLNLKYLNFQSNSTISVEIFKLSQYIIFDNKFIQILAHAVSTIFILIVGITFTFSRNNNKRGSVVNHYILLK